MLMEKDMERMPATPGDHSPPTQDVPSGTVESIGGGEVTLSQPTGLCNQFDEQLGTATIQPQPASSDPAQMDLIELKRKWGIYSPGGLKKRCREITSVGYVIKDLFPERTIGIVVGDSGIGKSPLLYQASICVAAGIPFLGHPVQQGCVLYADFENGLGDVDDMLTHMSKFLGLTEVPENNLRLWNQNDSSPKWSQQGGVTEMIRACRPRLAIIDSLGACYPEAEEKNSNTTKVFQQFRSVLRECGTTIVVVHHRKKPPDDYRNVPPPLEGPGNPRPWFNKSRGAGALINGSDIRLGIAVPESAGFIDTSGDGTEEIALLWRGFGRVRGEIPTTYLARVQDEDGNPLGYRRLTGAALLFNPEQESAFTRLPEETFRFKEGQAIYGKGPQATTDFLKKCGNVGIMEKLPKGQGYRKLRTAE